MGHVSGSHGGTVNLEHKPAPRLETHARDNKTVCEQQRTNELHNETNDRRITCRGRTQRMVLRPATLQYDETFRGRIIHHQVKRVKTPI